jgi:hypothetical protein
LISSFDCANARGAALDAASAATMPIDNIQDFIRPKRTQSMQSSNRVIWFKLRHG